MTKLLQNGENTALPTLAFYFPAQLVVGVVLGSSCSPGKDNLLSPTRALGWGGQGAALPSWAGCSVLSAETFQLCRAGGKGSWSSWPANSAFIQSHALRWFQQALPKFLFGLSEHLLPSKSVKFAKLGRTTNTHKHINTCLCGCLTTKHWNAARAVNWETHICQNAAPKCLSKAHTQNNWAKVLQKHTEDAGVNALVQNSHPHPFYLSIAESFIVFPIPYWEIPYTLLWHG